MRSLIFFIIISGFFFACQTETNTTVSNKTINEQVVPVLVSGEEHNASGPYFTANHKNQPVLVWTEKLPGGEETGNIVKYTQLDESGTGFSQIREVTTSKGCRGHDESMNKIAFKKDGTAIAVFSKRTPTKKNRFAGALYYTQSFDGGNKWTAPEYLHVGDTTHGLSRSFFDLALLPDGEVGAIWLDSRKTKERGDGSSLFFAKTEGKKGFLTDQIIGESTCQCCRTDLFVSGDGNIHAIFRDILQDSIRDMVHTISSDNGNTFSDPKRISPDDWVINGCPHTGPSMGETENGLHFAWFTMGGTPGIYYTETDNKSQKYSPRKLLTEHGKHPQLLALENEKVAFIWEEYNAKIGGHSAGHGAHGKAPKAKPIVDLETKPTSYIKVQVWQNGHPMLERWVSLPEQTAEYPVAVDLKNDEIGIAWVQNTEEDGYCIFYKKINL